MIRNYVKIAWRSLKKRRVYATIEVTGLVLGITCFGLVALYLQNELSYDRFFTNADRIYRINHVEDGSGNRYSGTSSALGFHARQEIPQVSQMTRLFFPYRMFGTSALIERNPDTRFYEDNLLVADSTFFQLFDFRAVEGNTKTALLRPDAIVLSQRTAEKYFGTKPALNQLLRINHGQPLVVTAVVDVPDNTHLNFDFLRPTHHDPTLGYVWEHTVAFTYLLVNDPQSVPAIERQLYQIVQRNSRSHQIAFLANYRHRLQPLHDVHTTVLNWDIITAVSTTQLWVVGLLAVFILLLAIVNFVNLSTARSSERVKEVGMNKILGAKSGQLIGQYVSEAILISFIAGIVSVGLMSLLIPYFNQIAQTSIQFAGQLNAGLLFGYALLLTLVGIAAGLYPAFILTRFRPTDVVKRTFTASPGHRRLRGALVVFQFVITIALLSGVFIVRQQMQFMQEANLGFNREQVMVMRFQEPSHQKFDRFKNDLLGHSEILKVAGASGPIGSEPGSQVFLTPDMPYETPRNFAKTMSIDPDFLALMDIPVMEGRAFQVGQSDAGTSYIVNEAAVKKFNLKNPLTARFRNAGDSSGRIVGVVKDFHFAALTTRIDALVLNLDTTSSYHYAFVKVKGGQIREAVNVVQGVWKRQNPDFPMAYFFQDEHFSKLYKQQEQIRQILLYFSVLALALACLGLFGMSLFITSRRTKEIGVRKVLGASVASIVALLSIDFLKLVLIAIALATPLAWYAMNQWLQDFAYRIDIAWWMFAGAGGLAIGIALLTVSFQSVKAALMNPVKSLRSE
ncbi:FtsX-like permease family protein [Spirosoma areae]